MLIYENNLILFETEVGIRKCVENKRMKNEDGKIIFRKKKLKRKRAKDLFWNKLYIKIIFKKTFKKRVSKERFKK